MLRFLGLVVLSAALLPAGAAHAGDVWTDPYPGIRHLERTTTRPAEKIHVVTVDLTRADLRLRATRYEDRGRTVSRFAAAYRCQVAVNGDFFHEDGTFTTLGLAMGAGAAWPGASDGPKWGFVAAGAENRVELALPEEVRAPDAWMAEIVGGYPLLVDGGAVAPGTACSSDFCDRNPRTAVGLSADGKTLFLVVVDGRTTSSVGMSLAELAALLVDLGAGRALNLDGGGSSALFIEGEGGVQNRPSDGVERSVGNHLGVAVVARSAGPDAGTGAARADAPPLGAPPDAGGTVAEDPGTELASGCGVVAGRPHATQALVFLALAFLRRRPR